MKPETKEFVRNFRWTEDKRLDKWSVIQKDKDGKYRGDCEDFAIGVLKREGNFWWDLLTIRAMFWYTRTRAYDGNRDRFWFFKRKYGGYHIHLWMKGKGWIDSSHRSFGERKLKKGIPFALPIVILKMALGRVI